MILRRIMEIERRSTKLPSVRDWLWNRPWTCRKRECGVNELMDHSSRTVAFSHKIQPRRHVADRKFNLKLKSIFDADREMIYSPSDNNNRSIHVCNSGVEVGEE
jgi:hypothetical protein